MKSEDEARGLAQRWLARHLPEEVVSSDDPWSGGPRISLLGQVGRRELGDGWADRYHPWATAWLALALPGGVRVHEEQRTVGKSPQMMPARIGFDDLEALCAFAGDGWPARLSALARRWERLKAEFPDTATAGVLRRTAEWTDVDFDLLLKAARWFTTAPPGWDSLTPRQIPIEGMHAKWLDTKRATVAVLAGLAHINLVDRPTTVSFTYADPRHRNGGGRAHDSYTLGDSVSLAYCPSVVLICENKDTVVMFPQVEGLVVVQGNGDAGPTILRQVQWIVDAPDVVYWGDLDAKGFVILNRLREVGISARSILMDPATHERYEPFGTNHEQSGAPIPVRARQDLRHLTTAERTVYDSLTDAKWSGHRRIEQERIPLQVALAAINELRGRPWGADECAGTR